MAELFRFVSLRGPAPVEAETAPFVVRVTAAASASASLSPQLDKLVERLAARGWAAGAGVLGELLQETFDGLTLALVNGGDGRLPAARNQAEAIVHRVASGGGEKASGEADRATLHVLAAEWIARMAALRTNDPYLGLSPREQGLRSRDYFSRAVLVAPAHGTVKFSFDASAAPFETRREEAASGGNRDRLRTQLRQAQAARRVTLAGIVGNTTVDPDGERDSRAGFAQVMAIVPSGELGYLDTSELEVVLDLLDARIRELVALLAQAGDYGEGQPLKDGKPAPVKSRNTGKPGKEPQGAPVPVRLGVGDLLLAELNSTSYRYGDIAHVENVLAGETRTRTFNRTRSTESDVLTISEKESVTETDSQSTQRFELEKASQSSLNETLNVNAGASVSGSYGPVTAQASFGLGTMTARESSQNQSSKLAQEVVSKATSKVRQLESTQARSVTKVVVADTTVHEMKNDDDGSGHIVGIYRWVDKEEHLQVVNYGQRLMLGLTVPEPGAYLRWLGNRKTSQGGIEPPTVQRGAVASPLQPGDLTPDNYLTWVSAYGATDVLPPPARFQTQSLGLQSDAAASGATGFVSRADTTLTVPAGYRAVLARGSAIAWDLNIPVGIELPDVQIAIGSVKHTITLSPNTGGVSPFSIPLAVPGSSTPAGTATASGAKLPIALNLFSSKSYAVTIEVVFERTDAGIAQWQIESWGKIMAAYRNARALDEEARARAELPGISVSGANPLENRRVERAEVKRIAIELLAGAVGSVDAVRDEGGARPHADRGQVAALEALTRFFEDAFEWEHLSWNCLDYFWAPEASWDSLMALSDPDPDHRAFLAAGAATATIPVRRGFETLVLHRFWAKRAWPGDRAPLPDVPEAMALGAEVATTARGAPQRGIPVPGSDWIERSPTSLVVLQPEGGLDWTPPAP